MTEDHDEHVRHRQRLIDMAARKASRAALDKARGKEPVTPRDYGTGPTPQRLAKAGRQVEAFSAARNENYQALRMLDGSALDRLASRGVITGDQYHAGSRFYSDWYLSGLAASGVIDPGRVVVDGGRGHQQSERKLQAMTAYKNAVKAIGKIHSAVITDLVLLEQSVEEWGRRWFGQKAPKLARAQAHAALILALSALDLHYYGPRKSSAAR